MVQKIAQKMIQKMVQSIFYPMPQVKGFCYMLRFMYFEVDYLICPCFKAKFQKSNKEI